ncbi:MAG: FG-GAP-like repeat-containing protein [Calditrichia bacterium]
MITKIHIFTFAVVIILSHNFLAAQTFTDVSGLLSPDFPVGNRTGQRGASAADFNNDGRVDIYHSNFRDPGRLYLNGGAGGFTDILQEINLDEGVNMWGAAFGDYNHDGYLDIMFEDLSAPSKLYKNNRNITFTEVNNSANVIVNNLAQGAAWGDFNLNGNLDLLIVNDHGDNQLFKNLDRAMFLDISISANVPTVGNSYGTSWGDINNDGFPDAYITTCHPSDPLRSINHLLLNNGDETFTDIGQSAGVADSLAGWGVIMFDYDQDGDMDMYVTNSYHAPRLAHNRLYRNNGDNTFSNASFASGLAGVFNENSYGVADADFDNDGWVDIYVTDLGRRDRLYHNNGDGTFTDIAIQAGIVLNDHRAVAVADFNNDGWIDIFTAGKPTNRLMFNNGGSNHWVTIRTRGISANYYGVGARIEVYADTLRQMQEIRAGDSFCSQNHNLTAHFGLGQNTQIDSLIVRWPGGTINKYFNIHQIDQQFTVIEGIGINHRPTTFELHTPANGDTITSLNQGVRFSWSPAADPDSEALSYTLFLTGTDLTSGISFNTVVTAIADTAVVLDQLILKENHAYRWSADASDGFLITAATNAFEFVIPQITAIGSEELGLPSEFRLLQNYPNPFNPTTTIRYELPVRSEVELVIYNSLGETVRVLTNGIQPAGLHTVQWDGKNRNGETVASGVYIYRLKTKDFTTARKMLLLR